MHKLIGYLIAWLSVFASTSVAANASCYDKDETTRTSIKELLSHPAKFEGRSVEVLGIYVFSFPTSFVVSDVEDYIRIKNDSSSSEIALEVEVNRHRLKVAKNTSLLNSKFGKGADGVVVKIKGTFFNRPAHGVRVAKVIDDIQLFAICNEDT